MQEQCKGGLLGKASPSKLVVCEKEIPRKQLLQNKKGAANVVRVSICSKLAANLGECIGE